MHSIGYNLTLLKEMMAEFRAHILSKELFWPLRKKSYDNVPFPQLSIGALLLTLDELEAQASEMNALDERTYQEQLNIFERFSQKFRVAIENKAARELITRTNLWRGYLQDVEEDPQSLEEYSRQVRNRVLMKKLSTLASVDQASIRFFTSNPVKYVMATVWSPYRITTLRRLPYCVIALYFV
jgi:hypothetical protein